MTEQRSPADSEGPPPGEELDRRLHAEVMGEDPSAGEVPAYSSDLKAARALERAFEYLNVDGIDGDYTAFASFAVGGGRLLFGEGEAPTAALALCRAALDALGQADREG